MPPATAEQLQRVHDPAYVAELLALQDSPFPVALDADTMVTRHTIAAALHAAGASVAAVEAVVAGPDPVAFCAVRPPGHHAETAQAMGFCYLNNIAIAAAHALTLPGIARVALVDFDVHHGNGTQEWAMTEPRALFASTHQMPFYPGTGLPHETGPHDNILNLPLMAGADSAAFRAAFTGHILPRLAAFAPDILFISAGFDAQDGDPLGGLCLTQADFAWAGQQLAAIARQYCAGRIVSCLEGGYDPDLLAASTVAYCRALVES